MKRPIPRSMDPSMSNLSFILSFTSFSLFMLIGRSTIPIGTFMRKMSLQLIVVRMPPRNIPMMEPRFHPSDVNPNARPRSCGSKLSDTTAVLDVPTSAPPTACSALNPMREIMSGESPHSAEPMTKIAIP